MTFNERHPASMQSPFMTITLRNYARHQPAITPHTAASIAHDFFLKIHYNHLSHPPEWLCCTSTVRYPMYICAAHHSSCLGASRCFLLYPPTRWVVHPFSRLARTTTIMVVYVYHYCMRYSSFPFGRLLCAFSLSIPIRVIPLLAQPSSSPIPPTLTPRL